MKLFDLVMPHHNDAATDTSDRFDINWKRVGQKIRNRAAEDTEKVKDWLNPQPQPELVPIPVPVHQPRYPGMRR